MKTKLFGLFLILVLCFMSIGILSSCDTGNHIIDDNNSVDLNKSKESIPTKLTFYMYGEEKEDTREVLDKVADASGLNIELDFIWFSPAEYNKKVISALYANADFDAFLCGKPKLVDIILLNSIGLAM